MNAHTATPDRPNPVIELIRRLRKATHRPEPANDPTRPATRSTRRTPDMYRGTITLALLRWIGHLEQFSQITNQQDKDDA